MHKYFTFTPGVYINFTTNNQNFQGSVKYHFNLVPAWWVFFNPVFTIHDIDVFHIGRPRIRTRHPLTQRLANELKG